MAGGLNKVSLIGHLGRDPEVRTFRSGGRMASFSLATAETWRDKETGERKERTEWHRIVVLNDGLISVAERFLQKGSRVYLEGKLETRKYTDRAKAERLVTEVVLRPWQGELLLLDARESGGGSPPEGDTDPPAGRLPYADDDIDDALSS